MSRIKLKKYAYFLLPFLGAFLFALLESLSFSFVGYEQSYLSCLLGIIFYFAAFNPTSFNIFFVFILGIISDYLIQAPVGMHAILFTLTFFLAYFNRRFILMSSFIGQWIIFMLISFLVLLLGIFLIKIAYGTPVIITPLFQEYFSTILCYPFVAWLCGVINTKLGRLI